MTKIKNTKSNRRFNAILLIGIIFSSLTIFGLVNNPNNQDIRSNASIEDDVKYCVNQPSCCDDIIRQLNAKGDLSGLPDDEQPYHGCDWPIRGYCQPSICNQLPGGIKYRGHCGWYYNFHDANGNDSHLGTNAPDGYGCMIGDSESTMRLKYGANGATNPPPQPTAPPPTATVFVQPTTIPTIVPTVIPTSILTQMPIYPTNIPTVSSNPTGVIAPTIYIPPTLYIYPTIIPTLTNNPNSYIYPTMTPIPTYTPTPTPKIFRLPNIFPPKEKVVSFIESVKVSLTNFLSKILP